MPEMQSEPVRTGMPPGAVVLSPSTTWAAEFDFALGCECADPALQIERWNLEASSPRELS
jgi:hypothetical protein